SSSLQQNVIKFLTMFLISYVEAAILKCNTFLSKTGLSESLPRLTSMIRGIGDPLVAVYARAYLCRVGMEVAPNVKESLNRNFFDFLLTFKLPSQIHSDTVQNQLAVQAVEIPVYLTLYSPAIDWMLRCIAYRAPETLLTEMKERCKKQGNNFSKMFQSRGKSMLSWEKDLLKMPSPCPTFRLAKHLLFRSLGLNLALADPPENDRLQILNEAWKVITKLRNPQDYINCAEVWVEYTCRHFTVNTILADIIKHLTPDRAFEDAYQQLQSVITKVITHFQDFSVLFSVEKFLPFLDVFQKESVRVEVCKCIMEAFIRHQQEVTKDPVILNALLHVCKTMHDSVNALTLEDEKRTLANLINGFIRMVSFGRDFEQQLSFYVETRSMFCNLEPVLIQLIHSVNHLAMETKKVMKGNHSRKTASFVRACVAFSFITIPSLTSVFTRLNLYLLSGQVALANQCLSQAAVSLVPDVPKTVNIDGKMRSSEPFILEFLANFFSTLLVVPDHPEQGVLFLVRGLLNVIEDYTWEDNSDDKVQIYTSVLHLLAALSQGSYLYHVDKVDSNDNLYGGDKKFLAEINRLCDTLIGQILEHLKTLGKEKPTLAQLRSACRIHASATSPAFGTLNATSHVSELALSEQIFAWRSVALPAKPSLANFRRLLNLPLYVTWGRHVLTVPARSTVGGGQPITALQSHKQRQASVPYQMKTLEYIKKKSKEPEWSHLSDLASRLPLQSRT
ncbi:hypothetical protein XELAEV_180452141mg, partial [Xenopus laevis]